MRQAVRPLYRITLSLTVILSAFTAIYFSLHVNAQAATRQVTTTSSSLLNCKNWNVLSSPSPGVSQNSLNGIVANSIFDIWAVGSYGTSDYSNTLIEHYDGTSWNVVSSPNIATYNTLSAITRVPGTNELWAVGNEGYPTPQTLIEHYDGTSWSIVSSPNVGTASNYLSGISAVNAKDIWAVGSYTNNGSYPSQTLIEHWNGTSWSVVSSPNLGESSWLNGVVKVVRGDVWAVGAYHIKSSFNQPLIEHWGGKSWSVSLSSGGDDILNAVTLVAPTYPYEMWAAGYENTPSGTVPLIEHYDGTSWTSSPSPTNVFGVLYGVAAASTKDVWVVGTLTEHWNGTYWKVIPSPNPGSPDVFNGISRAPYSQKEYAVGYYGNSNGLQTLVETNCM